MVFRPVLAANMIEKRRAAAALEQQITERHALVAELRKEIESTAGQVGVLREEFDARIRTLGALQGQMSEAAVRFAEQLRDLRQSEEAVDIRVARPASM
jgi:septal ring factor EnvC (AmiA/AmiB activator)